MNVLLNGIGMCPKRIDVTSLAIAAGGSLKELVHCVSQNSFCAFCFYPPPYSTAEDTGFYLENF